MDHNKRLMSTFLIILINKSVKPFVFSNMKISSSEMFKENRKGKKKI